MPRILVSYGRDQKYPPYLAALEACGLTASDVVPLKAESGAPIPGREFLDGADGLLLTGGDDLEPHLFGEQPLPEAHLDPAFPERDRMELGLVAAAHERKLPVLAICRGLQLLNVHFGGTLWQDLPFQAGVDGHDCSPEKGWPLERAAHAVEAVGPDCPIREWLGTEPVQVNSRHHQAVRRTGQGLATAAIARDGVIEAMAHEDLSWWAWGVQWHPENMLADDRQRQLFVEFLTAAEAHR